MGAALALLALLAGSILIVRIASVFLRLTGLPDHVARFQAVSALTGAGFTTSESEAIVNYPARRRTVVLLMVLGNLGLVSVLSTFFVALAGESGAPGGLMRQIALLALVVTVIALLVLSKTIDRWLCAAIEWIVRRLVRESSKDLEVLLALPGDVVIARHENRKGTPVELADALADVPSLQVISAQGGSVSDIARSVLLPGDEVICSGPVASHERLDNQLGR